MAKMKTSDDEMDRELVTNCDRSLDVVANCDHIEKEDNNISQSEIEKLILTIRGEQVIIDQDVARLYNVTTKRLNQQANRNSARFPHNFRFVLTKAECDEVVAKCDHLQSLKYRPTLPYAFTEQGIGQLSSVLHSKKAYLLGCKSEGPGCRSMRHHGDERNPRIHSRIGDIAIICIMAQNGEIILYQPDNNIRPKVRMEEDTVWLTQAQDKPIHHITTN